MEFENIKKFFLNKKKLNEDKDFFVIEYKNEGACHIVDKKLLGIMLAENRSLEEMVHRGYTSYVGFHFGKDKKVYTRHTLNGMGQFFYDMLLEEIGEQQMCKYFVALDDMNKNKNLHRFLSEKNKIALNFKHNSLSKIYRYEGKELIEQKNTKQKTQAMQANK